MAQETRLAPTYPVQFGRNTVPAMVGRIVDAPDDDDEQQMGIAIRNAAIEQEGKLWLAERTERMEKRFANTALQTVTELGRSALAVHQEFSGATDIESVVRGFALDIVISTADSLQKQKTALVEELGDVSQRDIRPKHKPKVTVIEQQEGYRKATLKDLGKAKFVRDE